MIAQFIDPHVHCRWNEYPDHSYLWRAQADAMRCGIGSLIEMPNPDPPLTNPDVIQERMDGPVKDSQDSLSTDTVRKVYRTSPPDHYIHIGVTTDIKQVEFAFRVAQTNPYIKGVKMFLTHSTGNMGLLDPDYQKQVWKTAVKVNYTGPVLMHCEDEKEWRIPFDYRDPVSHSLRQNPESEAIQVEQQYKMASDAKFRGTFYVCHVSSPYTLDYLACERNAARQAMARDKIVAEVTWHHLFLNYDDYQIHGNRVKINPPLRSPKMQELLLERVLRGEADIVGSDHAPHPLELKDSSTPPSGIPALPFWPKGAGKLKKLKMDPEKLESMTCGRAADLFDIEPPSPRRVQYDRSLWTFYGYNPFSRVDD